MKSKRATHNIHLAILAMIFANILWGMGPPIFKWSLGNIHIFTLAFLRFAVPALLLGIIGGKKIFIKPRDIGKVTLVGIFDITFNIGLYFIAILSTASINVPIIASASPIFLVIGSFLFLKEKFVKKILLGNMIGLTGVLLIIVQPILQNTEHATVFGNLLIALSTISAACGTISAKRIAGKYSAITITFWSFTIGAITFLPFFLHETFVYGFLPHLNSAGLLGIGYGILFSSLIAYFLNYWSLRYLPASQTSVFAYIDPIAGICIAAPLVHEYPSSLFIIGAALVFFGIYIAEGRLHYHPLHKLLQKA